MFTLAYDTLHHNGINFADPTVKGHLTNVSPG